MEPIRGNLLFFLQKNVIRNKNNKSVDKYTIYEHFVYVSDDYENYKLSHRNWGNKHFIIDLLTKRNKRKLKPQTGKYLFLPSHSIYTSTCFPNELWKNGTCFLFFITRFCYHSQILT